MDNFQFIETLYTNIHRQLRLSFFIGEECTVKHIRKMIVFIALVISIMCVYNFETELNKYVEADLSNNEVKKTASADEFNGEIDFEKLWKINPDVVG